MDLPPISSVTRPSGPAEMAREDPRTWEAARSFEASFIAEMLKASGLNAMPDSFGGGEGEGAFSSFLTREYAGIMSERGGFGLAERIFELLKLSEQGR